MTSFKMGDKEYTLCDDEQLLKLKEWLEAKVNWSEPINIDDLRKAVMKVAKQNTINSLDFKMSREDRQKLFQLKNNKGMK
jgi:hypothetical protein